jgi:hypothetical protein
MEPKKHVSVRYAELKKMMGDRAMFIEDIMRELRTSENYTRKLVNDLVYSGHVKEIKILTTRGRDKTKFQWEGCKPPPSEYTRSIKPATNVKIKRTDPLMIALYGE